MFTLQKKNRRFLFWVGVSLTLQAPAVLAGVPTTPTVRVRLTEAASKISLHGFDLHFYSPQTPRSGAIRALASVVDRRSSWEIRCKSGHVFAIGEKKVLHLQEPVSVESPAGFLSVNQRPYREVIKIYTNADQCEVVNEVSLEKYLEGLVNAEFSSKWNEEAISAQVIAARTYAYYQILNARKNPNSHFDVDATVKDQVYDGSIREDFRASRTVEKTHGMVLTVGPKAHPLPIKAFYHSTCGGSTELPQNVWGKEFIGFKHSVSCPFCKVSPAYTWHTDLRPADVISAILKSEENDAHWPKNWRNVVSDGGLLDIRVAKKNRQGRVAEIYTLWMDGNRTLELYFPAVKFRKMIGASRLRSTEFQVIAHRETSGWRWHLIGHGNGHGVGMCQWGAKVMGEKGFKTAAILKFYYPDAVPRKMW